jgi:iron complex outermembrane receptor protein
MKKISLLCLLASLFTIVEAQNIIAGKITNQDSEPLPGAGIYIPELNKGTISAIDGHFEIKNVPDGVYKIQVSFIGCKTFIESIRLSDSTLNLNLSLTESPVSGEEIVISGGYNSTQHQNAIEIEILKLKSPGNLTSPNLMQTLQKIPGVDMISKGSGVSKPVIRGLSMNDILVLNNGVRYENYQYSSHHPLGIDEYGIEDVEIIKGPASLLYGSDAIGGVINFIKEKPAPVGTIQGDYNMQLFSNTIGMGNNVGIKGSSQKFFGGVRIGQKTNADFLQGDGAFVPNTRANEYSLKANTGFTGKKGTFKLYYDYNTLKLGLAEEEAIDQTLVRGRKNEIFYQQFNTHMLSSQNRFYFGNMKLDINSSYQNTELIHFGEPEQYELQMKLATLIYESKLYLHTDAQSDFIIGIQGINQFNTNINSRETILLPDATTGNYSVFGLFQQSIFSSLKLQMGARYDYKTINTQSAGTEDLPGYRTPLGKEYGSFSGSLGVIYTITKDALLRANFASAYRTPNLAELTSDGQHEIRYEKGNRNLVPENSYEADISLHIHKDNYTFDVSGFYNAISHYIFISPTGDTASNGIPVYQYVQNNSFLFGGEAGLHIHPKPIQWLHFETTFASVTGKQQNGNYLPFVPANKLNFELRAESEKAGKQNSFYFALSTITAFDQNYAAPDESVTSGYTLVNVGVGANLNVKNQILSISLNADNLFDKKYIDHLSTLKEVNLFNPGRNISLTLRIPFGFD